MGTLSSSSSHLENTPSRTWSLWHPGHTGVSTIVLLTALTMGQRMAIGQIDTIVCTTNTQTHSASACRTGNRRYIQVSQPLVRSHLCAVNSITNISMIASVFPLPAPITLTLCDWLVTCEKKLGKLKTDDHKAIWIETRASIEVKACSFPLIALADNMYVWEDFDKNCPLIWFGPETLPIWIWPRIQICFF